MKDKQQFHGKVRAFTSGDMACSLGHEAWHPGTILTHSQIVFVAGGSSGLGKEISKALAARGQWLYPYDDSPAQLMDEVGAHITIFARRQGPLDEARNKILTARRDTKQEVHAVSLDLSNPSEVQSAFLLKPAMFHRGLAD